VKFIETTPLNWRRFPLRKTEDREEPGEAFYLKELSFKEIRLTDLRSSDPKGKGGNKKERLS
jgi:hypothetical protein